MTSPAEWLVPARERLDRRQARLEEVFGTLDVPDGKSIAVIDDHTIVVRIGDVHWVDGDLVGRRLGAFMRRDDHASTEVYEATSMNEPYPSGKPIPLGRLGLKQNTPPQQVVDALAHERTTSDQLDLTNQQENERP